MLSPWPSAAHHHLALRGPRGPLALAKRVDRYDRVIIQFHPDVFYPLPLDDRERLLVTAGLLAAFGRKRNVEVRLHEMNFAWGRETGLFGRMWRALWRLPAAITVHTERERQLVADSVRLPPERISVRDHGLTFVRRATIDRNEARARLGIDDATFMFLAIGFIQPHKGFDRAVAAFDGLADHGCRLDVVGSVRVDEPAFVDYADELRTHIATTRGAHMHEGYVSDEMFDVWLVAADVLLLPYRHIWSSGVLQRAALYGTNVIATRVGSLDEQGHEGVVLVESDAELAMAMRTAAGVPSQQTDGAAWPVRVGRGSRPARRAGRDPTARRCPHPERRQPRGYPTRTKPPPCSACRCSLCPTPVFEQPDRLPRQAGRAEAHGVADRSDHPPGQHRAPRRGRSRPQRRVDERRGRAASTRSRASPATARRVAIRRSDDEQFVADSFQELLDRPVDPAGRAYYGKLLAAGTSRAELRRHAGRFRRVPEPHRRP